MNRRLACIATKLWPDVIARLIADYAAPLTLKDKVELLAGHWIGYNIIFESENITLKWAAPHMICVVLASDEDDDYPMMKTVDELCSCIEARDWSPLDRFKSLFTEQEDNEIRGWLAHAK